MNFLLTSILLFFPAISAIAQDIKGKVIDGESSEPLAFANVILINARDSSFVKGTVTDKNGNFIISSDGGKNFLIRITFLGYQKRLFKVENNEGLLIKLQPLNQTLSEVKVTAPRPLIKMNNGNISTDIQKSYLKELGTASDILGQLPLVAKDGDKYTVFGKGAPLIYINNRKISDLTELDNLNSNSIKRVTVVTNPGAEYAATTKSVILIETIRKDEGLTGDIGCNMRIGNRISYGTREFFNYRISNLDIFGNISYSQDKGHQRIKWEQLTDNENVFLTELSKKNTELKLLKTSLGINYTLNKYSSMGMRYDYTRTPRDNQVCGSLTNILNNNKSIDEINSTLNRHEEREGHYLNVYYAGRFSDWLSAKIDMDFAKGNLQNNQVINNKTSNYNGGAISNGNQNYNLFASKLVFSSPIGMGKLIYGSEYAQTRNEQNFYVTQQDSNIVLVPDNSLAKQNLAAGFTSYNLSMGHFSIDTGVRFEYVKFRYYRYGKKQDESFTSNDWFPNAGIMFSNNKLQVSLGYQRSINRPSYYQLRNSIQYNNLYAYEAGNPFLKPSIENNISLAFKWEKLLLNANFDIYKNAILFVSKPYEEAKLISGPDNFSKYKNFSISAFYSEAIGIWKPSIEIGCSKDFFHYGSPEKSYGTPIFHVTQRNHLALKNNFLIGADFSYSTKGYSEAEYVYDSFIANVYLSKLLFKDKLRITFQGYDIFGTYSYKRRRDMNNISTYVYNKLGKQSVFISISYNFNSVKSRYQGKQVGNEMNRL